MMKSLTSNRHWRGVAAACCASLLLGCGWRAAHAAEWPVPALPESATPYHMGGEITAGGMPMRMRGFTSPAPRAEVAAWFRRSMGARLVENQVGSKLVLGQARGEFYVTVQLEALPDGTHGLVAVSHLKAAADKRGASREAAQRLQNRLPPGSQVVQQLSSRDGNKLSNYVMLSNKHGESVNRDRMISLLAEDGLQLERERRIDSAMAQQAALKNGSTMWFKGPGKEAIVVLGRNQQGDSVVVFNKVTLMEQLK